MTRRADQAAIEPRAKLAGIRPAQRRPLTEQVGDQLLELIAGTEQPELTLPIERELSEQLAVSRNVLREALSALDRQGIVERRGKARVAFTARARAQLVARVPGRGGRRHETRNPLELRLIVEPEAAALAASRATQDDLAELERRLGAMEAALGDPPGVVEHDAAFHAAIAAASGNDMLADLVTALADVLRPSRELSFEPVHAPERALEDHRQILLAIAAHDPERAREAMRVHLCHIDELIRATTDSG